MKLKLFLGLAMLVGCLTSVACTSTVPANAHTNDKTMKNGTNEPPPPPSPPLPPKS